MAVASISKRVPDDIRSVLVKKATALFVKKGFDRTTTRDLSRTLGWSMGRLYQYVASKDDLMDLLMDFMAERDDAFIDAAIAASVGLDASNALKISIRLYVEKNDRYQDLYKFLTHITLNLDRAGRRRVVESSRRVKDYFESLVVRGIETGEFRTENTELVAWDIFMTGTWTTRRYLLNRRYDIEEFINEKTRNILLQLGAG